MEKDLQPDDEGYLENDMENIMDRVNAGYIAYLQIHTMMNYPLFHKKDIVALRKTEHYKVNDIVLYQFENFYFLRRIIAVEQDKYYVCGDHEYEVRIIHANDILARAISRERGTKRLSLILMNKKKFYSNAILKKGKIRLKHHTFYDDETTINKIYDKALLAQDQPLEHQDQIKVPEMPLDSRLALQLEAFQSPEDRLREFVAEQNVKEAENNFEEESDIKNYEE